MEVSSKCYLLIYSPFVITEILCPDFPVSRSFLGMSPVPLPSHLTFSPAFPTAYLDIISQSPHTQIINLRHKSATSSIFLALANDPIIISGTRLQACGVAFFTHPSYPVVTKFGFISFLLNLACLHFSLLSHCPHSNLIRASDAWATFLSFLIGLLTPFFSSLTHSSRLMLLKCPLSSWYFPIHNIKSFPGGFETKSELFCFAFKVLQNHLALLSFQIRSVSSLSYKNITTPASVPLCKHVKLTWPKRTHPSAYFFDLPLIFAHLLPMFFT